MKKIYFTMLAVLTLGMTSCDMDLKPYDSIPDTEALRSYTDFKTCVWGFIHHCVD